MKLYQWISLAFFGAFVVVRLVTMAPVDDRPYTGCELPGAVPECAQVMQHVEEYSSVYKTPLLRLLPPTGPTPEMKINAIEQQLYVENKLRWERHQRERWKAAEERQHKAEEEVARRAGVQ